MTANPPVAIPRGSHGATPRPSVDSHSRFIVQSPAEQVAIGLIEGAAVPGDRQDYYQITRSPFHRMLDTHLERLRRVWHIVDQASQAVPATLQDTQERLQQMNRFYREAVKSNEALMARLSKDES